MQEAVALSMSEYAALRGAHADRERRMDRRFAILTALLANCHRNPDRKPTPFEPHDFYPDLRPPETEEQFARRVAAAFGLFLEE